MKQLTEEEFPFIKEAFVLNENLDKAEVRKHIMNAEAEGLRPAITRVGVIEQVIGEGDDRFVVARCNDDYVFIFNDQLSENLKKMTNEQLIKKRASFKLIGKHDDKLIGSCTYSREMYQNLMNQGKILKGKIKEIKTSRNGGEYAIVTSKGDDILIPASEFALPIFLTPEEKIGKIVEFVICEIRPNGKLIGSTKVVTEYREEQLKYFYDIGESFKAEVEKTVPMGAFLTYKHNNGLVLRNKDFSSNYTNCKEVLEKGDTVSVKIKAISKTSGKIIVELINKYTVEPPLKIENIQVEDEFDGEVVGVETFGCFVRICPGQDVLCPVNAEKREPVIGDSVRVKITVASTGDSRQKLRGQIVKYNDVRLDLSKYNLI